MIKLRKKDNAMFWYWLSGFAGILDGLITVLSFARITSNFALPINIKYLKEYQLNVPSDEVKK